MLLSLEYVFLWVLLYSFLGWVYESIVVSVQERRPVNRGFLMGPLCPIYGVGAVGAALVLSPLRNPVLLFLVGAVLATVLEYATSWAMERLFDARWWDYSQYRFNINGRVCLLGAVIFGAFAVIVVNWTQPLVESFTDRVPVPAVHTIAAVCFLLLVADLTVTLSGMSGFMQRVERFGQLAAEYGVNARRTVDGYANRAGESISNGRQALGNAMGNAMGSARDAAARTWSGMPQPSLNRLRAKAADLFNAQQRRMLDAFPELTSLSHRGLIEQLRDVLKTGRRR
ncbi:hypothetical protein GFD22_00870 [Bifidobacterium avesanii]|uniref:Transporter n=1 Tax=Bifidobacterium avesanii TaxID=1798157 RepID=A0A7K3TF74_9BIFI|nr:hypothetical protein [Bifidobacterium avesanii]